MLASASLAGNVARARLVLSFSCGHGRPPAGGEGGRPHRLPSVSTSLGVGRAVGDILNGQHYSIPLGFRLAVACSTTCPRRGLTKLDG